MTTQEIVSKLWNLCNVLRDDGITYHQYVTELTYILFLKMAKETGAEKQIPEGYRWDVLKSKSGVELKKFYKELLNHLGENCTGRVREIYQGSMTLLLAMQMAICQHVKKHIVKKIQMEDGENSHMMKF